MANFNCPKCGTITTYTPGIDHAYCKSCGYQSLPLKQHINLKLKEATQLATAGQSSLAIAQFQSLLQLPLTPDQKAGVFIWIARLSPGTINKRKYLSQAISLNPSKAISQLAQQELKLVESTLSKGYSSSAHSSATTAATASSVKQTGELKTALACPSCGAAFIFSQEREKIRCIHCQTQITRAEALPRKYQPPIGLISFKIELPQASQLVAQYLHEEGIRADVDTITLPMAVFIPVWTFDVTEINQASTLLINTPATKHLPDELWFSLLEINRDEIKPYDENELVDIIAEAPDLPDTQASQEARAEAAAQIRQANPNLPNPPGTQQFIINTSKLIYVPCWLASYRYRGSIYRIAINGQTGKYSGEHPPFR